MEIFRKLGRARILKEIPTQALPPEEIEKVRFYQIKSETVAFFRDIGINGVPTVGETPHYKFARALLTNGRQTAPSEEELYRNYLQASWVGRNWDIEEKIKKFKDHLHIFLFSQSKNGPLLTTFLGENDLYAPDGNHRLAFSLAANRKLDVKVAPFHKALKILNPTNEHYGRGNYGKPCQSLYFKERMIVTGRRVDLIERINLIPAEAIEDRSVLDIASNFGMSSLIANSRGAKTCVGIERFQNLVDFANKMSILHERERSVSFLQYDIDHPEKPIPDIYETAFAFSVNSEFKNKSNLVSIFENYVEKYVVFETDPDRKIEDYPEIFKSGIFKNHEFLGNLSRSYNRPDKCRKLYILEK